MSLFGNNKLDKDLLDSVQEVMSQQHIKMRPELVEAAKKAGESIREVAYLEDRTATIKEAFKNSVKDLNEFRNTHVMNEFHRIAEAESKKKLVEDRKFNTLSKKLYNKAYATVSSKNKWANRDFDKQFDKEVDNEYKKLVDIEIKNNPSLKSKFYKK